jgi:glutamate transport system substrate-binding protein
MRKTWRVIAVVLACGALMAACGGDDDDADVSSDKPEAKAPPTFAAGSTMEAIQKKGKLVVGTKFDQPLFGLKNPTTGKVEGFDVEIANLMAKGIFGDNIEGKVEFIEAVSKNREPYIQEGKVDIVVATYTINDTRKQVVDFAGPYFVAHQDIMVKKDDTTIKGVDDLNGKKVCSAQGSTSIKNVQAKAPQADTSITFDVYSKCAEALGDGRIQAVTTDNVILGGLVADSQGKYKLVNAPFTDEPYGIGLKKGATDFRNFLNDRLEAIYKDGSWKKAFETTTSAGGLPVPEPPPVNRY